MGNISLVLRKRASTFWRTLSGAASTVRQATPPVFANYSQSRQYLGEAFGAWFSMQRYLGKHVGSVLVLSRLGSVLPSPAALLLVFQATARDHHHIGRLQGRDYQEITRDHQETGRRPPGDQRQPENQKTSGGVLAVSCWSPGVRLVSSVIGGLLVVFS